jgi:hypothetical protein
MFVERCIESMGDHERALEYLDKMRSKIRDKTAWRLARGTLAVTYDDQQNYSVLLGNWINQKRNIII